MRAKLVAWHVSLAADHAHPARWPRRGLNGPEALSGVTTEKHRVVVVEAGLGSRCSTTHAVACIGRALMPAAHARRPQVGKHRPAGELVAAAAAAGRAEPALGTTAWAETHHAGALPTAGAHRPGRAGGRLKPESTSCCALNRTSPVNKVGRKNNGTPGQPRSQRASTQEGPPVPRDGPADSQTAGSPDGCQFGTMCSGVQQRRSSRAACALRRHRSATAPVPPRRPAPAAWPAPLRATSAPARSWCRR